MIWFAEAVQLDFRLGLWRFQDLADTLRYGWFIASQSGRGLQGVFGLVMGAKSILKFLAHIHRTA